MCVCVMCVWFVGQRAGAQSRSCARLAGRTAFRLIQDWPANSPAARPQHALATSNANAHQYRARAHRSREQTTSLVLASLAIARDRCDSRSRAEGEQKGISILFMHINMDIATQSFEFTAGIRRLQRMSHLVRGRGRGLGQATCKRASSR